MHLVTIDTNLKGLYEVTFQGKIIGKGSTLELATKKASKWFKGQGL